MQVIIMLILIILGYIALCQTIGSFTDEHRIKIAVYIVILFIYLALVGIITLMYFQSGYNEAIILDAFILETIAGCILIGIHAHKNKDTMDKTWVMIFFVYFAIVLYLTIFMRIGNEYTAVHSDAFARIKMAIETNSFEPLEHLVSNILFFIPLGFIVPMTNRKHFSKFGFAFLGGIALSTIIEGVQLVQRLGDSDAGDILANSIGALIGYGLYLMINRIEKNWRL